MKKYIAIPIVILITIGTAFFFIPNSSTNPVFKKNNVLNNVNVEFHIDKVVTKEILGEPYSFVYFKYIIQNQHQQTLYFHPGKIKIKYNGLMNDSTEYNSLASAMTELMKLPRGEKEYFLYLVFKRPNISIDITEFKIWNTGIIAKPGDK